MIRLINKSNKKVESFEPDIALRNLVLDGDKYLPVNGETYIIKTEDGRFMPTDGKDLYRHLGDTKGELVTAEDYAITTAVQAEYSQTGQFIKSALSEAVLLGLNKDKALPDDPVSRSIELKRRELFGGAETAGSIFGGIAPLVAGGVGAIIQKGAKTGAKAVLGKGLKKAGQLPSAQVFKGASKAGKVAAKQAKKLGLGTRSQKVIETLGTGAAFAGVAAGVEGIREGIKVSKENEFTETSQAMKSILGGGAIKAGEVFAASATTMAVLGGVGKGVGMTIKGSATAGKWVADKTPVYFRDRFFGTEFGARGKNQMEQLKKAFGGKKAPREKVLKEADDFLVKQGLSTPKTRDELLPAIDRNLSGVGQQIDKVRSSVFSGIQRSPSLAGKYITDIQKGLKQEFDRFSNVQKIGLYKPYVRELSQMHGILGRYIEKKRAGNVIFHVARKDFNPNEINHLMRNLAAGSKHLKTEKATKPLDVAYREGYNRISQLEDDIFKKIAEKIKTEAKEQLKGQTQIQAGNFAKNISNLKLLKDDFFRLKTVKGVVDNAMPPGSNFMRGFANFRDIALLGGFAYALGPAGVALGGGIAIGAQQAHRQGYQYLQLARLAEKTQSAMGNMKTLKGTKKLFTKTIKPLQWGANAGQMTVPALSTLFFGKSLNTLNEFNEQFNSLPAHKKFAYANEDLISMVQDYGGNDNTTRFLSKVNNMKRRAMRYMPEGTRDLKGNKVYSKADTNRFLQTLSQGMTPEGFIKSIQDKNLTQEGYNLFKENYPDTLSRLNMNFLQLVREGKLSQNDYKFYQAWLRAQNTDLDDFVFKTLDGILHSQNTRTPRAKLTTNKPTISASIAGGY